MSLRIRQLLAWMALKGIKPKAVAQANGVSKTAVYRYIRGDMSSSTLRTWFRSRGCPAKHLPPAAKKPTSNLGKAA